MHSLLNEKIEKSIFIIRNQKIMMDQHLADLYEVTTKQLNQQVRRNHDRFPLAIRPQSAL